MASAKISAEIPMESKVTRIDIVDRDEDVYCRATISDLSHTGGT
jgi:hypothetical protein